MKKILLTGALASLFLFSCTEERVMDDSQSHPSNLMVSMNKDTKMKTDFAKALAKALKDHKELRDFVKTEALKQINKDYDVVYHVVKNKPIASIAMKNGSSPTLHNILLPYFESEAQLQEIESKLPLLTIFVPDLQEESFSAERWNTLTEVPLVAVRTFESNDVPIYGADGTNFVLEAQYMPDFPVVVVKDNERVISNISAAQYNNLDTEIVTKPTDDVQLRLTDNNFSNKITVNNGGNNGSTSYPRVDPIHQQAYDVYQNYTLGGWQRDYIYYGLTPTNTEGGINPTYREELNSFKLSGSPQDAYYKIASQQDPRLVTDFVPYNNGFTGWTDGSFEFGILLYYGAKNSNLGITLRKGFPANPNDLFEITYIPHPNVLIANVWKVKKAQITGLKMMDFYTNPDPRVQFSVWDLANYSNQFKLEFEEIDVATTYTGTVTQSNKYNMNFSLDPTFGILKKIGLKFGASYEDTKGNTYVTQYTEVSDKLGDVDVNFYDNVVNMVNGQLIPNKLQVL